MSVAWATSASASPHLPSPVLSKYLHHGASVHAQTYTLLPLTHVRICFSKVNVQGLAQEVYICRWQEMNLPSVFQLVSPAVLCKAPGLCLHAVRASPHTRAFSWSGVQLCPPCLKLNHRSCVSGCVLSQSYIYVVVQLEDRCFSPPLLFFLTL